MYYQLQRSHFAGVNSISYLLCLFIEHYQHSVIQAKACSKGIAVLFLPITIHSSQLTTAQRLQWRLLHITFSTLNTQPGANARWNLFSVEWPLPIVIAEWKLVLHLFNDPLANFNTKNLDLAIPPRKLTWTSKCLGSEHLK